MSTDKRPIEERIAALMGKSAYRDLRDGFSVGGLPQFTDQDVAAAIGAAARAAGRLGVMALETYYGSTLLHQAALLREWEDAERKEGDTREQIVLTRFGGALAIQQMAGGKVTGSAYSEYAYLIFSRREKLEARVRAAGAWLEGQRFTALREVKVQLFHEAA
ncbi:hypothetical protein [Stenotrophomonas maltophilia]|uniref:hypothetical protein n=1 Tax=Stenotrophomonas maltophilia TaxID=40324 RepID=UPI003C2CCB62